ncbi:hypothetical protein Tco_1302753 [Tanacetum coccineum]
MNFGGNHHSNHSILIFQSSITSSSSFSSSKDVLRLTTTFITFLVKKQVSSPKVRVASVTKVQLLPWFLEGHCKKGQEWILRGNQDTAVSKGKEVINGLSFYKMETDEISERYIAQCFVNGLEVFDGEINLAFDENLISNELAVKLCLDYEKDKVELDGKTEKEDEEAVKRIKGEALKEKEDPRREDMKKVDRGITMINHTQADAMGKLSNVLFQVGVTTIIAKFLILDIPIDCDAPIVVGRGFLHTMGSILNASERIFSTFDGICHQTFRAARFDVLRTAKSDSDDEEEYVIKRNKFGAPIYGPRPAPYLNCTDPEDRSSAIQTEHTTEEADRHYPNAQKRNRGKVMAEPAGDVHHRFFYYRKDVPEMLSLAESEEEIFTSVAWIRAFNINEPIYVKLCHEFYSTYEFDEVCDDDELQSKKIIKFRLGGRAHSLTLLEFACRLGLYQAVELEEDGFNVTFDGGFTYDDNLMTTNYWLSISLEKTLFLSRESYFYYQEPNFEGDPQNDHLWFVSEDDWLRDLDTTTLRDLIDFDGKLIPEDPQPGVPRVGIPRPPRASMQDLYDRMGRMEIRQDAIERMEYRQSYHWDIYHGVFKHMAGGYSVPLQGTYNPPGYAQP